MSSFRGGAPGGAKVKRVMTQAINLIFEFLKTKAVVQIWLFENTTMKIEGVIVGFDEYMNVCLDQAVEINVKKGTRKEIGKILLKGDTITLMQRAVPIIEAAAST
jgi:small nuclear ribonucleoprotein E